MPTILLNMIVKDESHIIEKTLTTLCDKIDFSYWVISDTGSTDNTKDIIRAFFEKRGIPGELFDDEWKDFGHNRSMALAHAYNKSDLLFVFDADDDLVGNFVIPKAIADAYHLHFGSGYSLNYWRICMVNNRKKWRYIGVLHEYIECVDRPIKHFFIEGEYYVRHGTSGQRSNAIDKYEKDAIVLEKAFKELDETDLLRNRYAFYCANSHKDAGNIDRAIVWYKIAIGLKKGWDQEKYRSCVMLFEMFSKKNKMEEAVFYALQSYKFDKHRVEGIYKLIRYYCTNNMEDVALAYYRLIEDWYENTYIKQGDALTDKLFVDITDYDIYLPYFMIIVSNKVGKPDIGIRMYEFIFRNKKMGPILFTETLLSNFKFFINYIFKKNKQIIIYAKEYIKVLESEKIHVPKSFYENIAELTRRSNNK